ncbi:MAG: PEP-CTERM sorting domain-containing protein [Gammaproteobacteria bacterium]|nr:PEP-CTERM sorting domain-containing protein [Gammaproteobacteria bacterium]MCF6230450.1 PEP-CTERM sorting domain-containing protein [Gammaproteobacteria bacterium]
MKNGIWAAPFQKNALSAAVCLGLIAAASNAQATILTAGATVDLDIATTVSTTGTDPVHVNVSEYLYDANGGGYASGWGNDSGSMFSSASGNGFFSAEGHIQQSVEFTNNSGVAQSYSFDFTINNGALSAYAYDTLVGGEYVQAGNTVAIQLNGVDIYTSNATLLTDASGSDLTTSGAVLGSYTAGSSSYSWGTYTGTLDLGIFNPGESFLLEYDIFTFAESNVAGLIATDCGFDGPEQDWWAEECGSWFVTSGGSRFGDPNGINGMPITNNTVTGNPPASVPEPGLLFLLGGGVAGLAFARRNRARKG